jgi:hypothetical protein
MVSIVASLATIWHETMQPNSPKPSAAGAQEYRELLHLAAEIEAFLPDGDPCLQQWNASAESLPGDVDLESLSGERALDELAFALRFEWLKATHQVSSRYLMSPPHEQLKLMPSGEKFQFDYERSSRPERLEQRGNKCLPAPHGWVGKCMLFSSGMSAISTLVQVCCARLEGAMPDKPVQLDMFGGYFETWRLLDAVHDSVLKVEYVQSNAQLADRIVDGAVDILVIEPVAYDWDMTVFDLDGFAKAWQSAGIKRPRMVIVDTSLNANTFSLEDILPAFGADLPWMVAFVRSGLKLDQQGLEFSNVGIVNLYIPEGGASPIHFERLKQRLSVNRAITGGGLTVNQTAALEIPCFLNAKSTSVHADRVFQNNRLLAQRIENGGGIFSRINHPCLAKGIEPKWAVSPFVVFHLAEDSTGHHGKLVAILVYEARKRGLCFELASSFGFRGHRFEVIRPLVQIREMGAQTGLLKIAMGSRKGPSFEGIIELINEIAGFPDWQALTDTYPDVKAYVKGNFGVYIEKPPRP